MAESHEIRIQNFQFRTAGKKVNGLIGDNTGMKRLAGTISNLQRRFRNGLMIFRFFIPKLKTLINMKSKWLLFISLSFLLFCGCNKSSSEDNTSEEYGTKLNSWTFTEGSTTYNGLIVFEKASLNTFLQDNNSYTFAVLGGEITSGYLFNIVLSLVDLNFTVKTYQSGVAGNDYQNAFYYTESPVSADNIYKSSNLDPGPVMTHTITAYDAVNDIVTITFSGKAFDINGNEVNITKGKLTTKIDRL